MNRETLDKFCERGILVLVLAILVFGPLAMGAVDAWAFLIIQALVIGVMLVWAIALVDQSPSPIVLAADRLGGAGICRLCHWPLPHRRH